MPVQLVGVMPCSCCASPCTSYFILFLRGEAEDCAHPAVLKDNVVLGAGTQSMCSSPLHLPSLDESGDILRSKFGETGACSHSRHSFRSLREGRHLPRVACDFLASASLCLVTPNVKLHVSVTHGVSTWRGRAPDLGISQPSERSSSTSWRVTDTSHHQASGLPNVGLDQSGTCLLPVSAPLPGGTGLRSFLHGR